MTREQEKYWLQGYAAALANMVRWTGDQRTARRIMRDDNITMQKLVGVGVNWSDLNRLKVPR